MCRRVSAIWNAHILRSIRQGQPFHSRCVLLQSVVAAEGSLGELPARCEGARLPLVVVVVAIAVAFRVVVALLRRRRHRRRRRCCGCYCSCCCRRCSRCCRLSSCCVLLFSSCWCCIGSWITRSRFAKKNYISVRWGSVVFARCSSRYKLKGNTIFYVRTMWKSTGCEQGRPPDTCRSSTMPKKNKCVFSPPGYFGSAFDTFFVHLFVLWFE